MTQNGKTVDQVSQTFTCLGTYRGVPLIRDANLKPLFGQVSDAPGSTTSGANGAWSMHCPSISGNFQMIRGALYPMSMGWITRCIDQGVGFSYLKDQCSVDSCFGTTCQVGEQCVSGFCSAPAGPAFGVDAGNARNYVVLNQVLTVLQSPVYQQAPGYKRISLFANSFKQQRGTIEGEGNGPGQRQDYLLDAGNAENQAFLENFLAQLNAHNGLNQGGDTIRTAAARAIGSRRDEIRNGNRGGGN